MAATFIPEAELDREESKLLAESLADVSSFYSQVVDPKIVAWVGLLGVAGKIYGPRIGAFALRMKMEKAGRPPRANLSVVPQKPAAQSAPAPVANPAEVVATMISVPTPEG